MAYIDRTEEFKLATNTQMRTTAPSGVPMSPPQFSVSKFSRVTASLSNRVSKTTLKLQRLTDRIFSFSCLFLVVRRKSLFDDKSAEINQLTGSIKQDITSINAELEELEVCNTNSVQFFLAIRPYAKIRICTESRV